MSTSLKAWRYREIVPRKVDSLFSRFIDPIGQRIRQKPRESALETLLRKRIVVSNHGRVYLTPAGQFFLWRSHGWAKPWERLTTNEKVKWRERLTMVAMAEPNIRAPVVFPKKGNKTRTYNAHVRLSLTEFREKINDDINHLTDAITGSTNQHAISEFRSRIVRIRNLQSIIDAVIEDLRYGEIDLTM